MKEILSYTWTRLFPFTGDSCVLVKDTLNGFFELTQCPSNDLYMPCLLPPGLQIQKVRLMCTLLALKLFIWDFNCCVFDTVALTDGVDLVLVRDGAEVVHSSWQFPLFLLGELATSLGLLYIQFVLLAIILIGTSVFLFCDTTVWLALMSTESSHPCISL